MDIIFGVWYILRAICEMQGGVLLLVLDENKPITARSVRMRAEITLLGGGLYKGKLYSRYLEEPYEFLTLIRMLEKMEHIFNEIKFPHAFLSPRTFVATKKKHGKAPLEDVEDEREAGDGDVFEAQADDGAKMPSDGGSKEGRCSFEILVNFRQNASWQGEIRWLEKELRKDFKSELEMFRLIDGALLETEGGEPRLIWE
ncbi:MAG: hypothetical protein FWB75_00555 [Oscillospiraceae bacterium]|nr:hypothetical protein [Oscillospiraceae bacterium]